VPAARAPRTEGQTAAIALAAGLAEEVRSADAVLLAVPLYNFGIPQHVKTWIDVVLGGARRRPRRRLRRGHPARGLGPLHRLPPPHHRRRVGRGPDARRARVTLVGVNPALDNFKELSDQFKDAAHIAAAQAGKALATA
jgi:FMN-dependent NADH-azoreductase